MKTMLLAFEEELVKVLSWPNWSLRYGTIGLLRIVDTL